MGNVPHNRGCGELVALGIGILAASLAGVISAVVTVVNVLS